MDAFEDPYAPRSSESYARAAEGAVPGAGSAASAPSVDEQDTAAAGSSSAADDNARAGPSRSRAQPQAEEPLFGGTPFRDSQFAGATPFQTDDGAEGSGSAESGKDELYALLNVDKGASEEKIKDAYRSLAVVFHPDKHTDPGRKLAAEAQFRRIQRAYEVLSDPERRGVYDHFGEVGLRSSWALSARGKTPADMRAEFEKELLERRTKEAENLVRSRGDFTATIDAAALLAPGARIRRPPQRAGQPVTVQDRWNAVGVTSLVGRHGFEAQATNTTFLNLTGQLMTRGGLGGGNLVGTVKTQWSSRFGTETAVALIRPRHVTHKGAFALDPNTFITYAANMHTLSVPPSLTVTAGQRISKTSQMTGFTTVRTGTYQLGPWGDPQKMSQMQLMRREPAAIAVGVTSQTPEGGSWTVQTSLSTVDTSLSCDYGTKVLGGVRVRVGANVGTGSGLSFNVNADRRITETTRGGLGLSTGLPGPVTLRVKFNRLGQKVTVPIILAPEFRSDLVLACTLVPAAAMTLLHHYYLVPSKRRRIEGKLRELRRENEDMIRERREAARSAQELLREQARKRWQQESGRGGLVVLEAWYGKRSAFPAPREGDADQLEHEIWRIESLPPTNGSAQSGTPDEEAEYWDVRIPLQAMVSKGQLVVAGGRAKSSLLGFHDPCMGEKKHLRVRYLFRNRLHEAVVDDVSPLAAPLRAHQL